jgi:hypothetical protein
MVEQAIGQAIDASTGNTARMVATSGGSGVSSIPTEK